MSFVPRTPQGVPGTACLLLLLLAAARCSAKLMAVVRTAGEWLWEAGCFIEGLPAIVECVATHVGTMIGSFARERVRRIGQQVSGEEEREF